MKNFYTLRIKRKDIEKSEVFIFHLDGNFICKKLEEQFNEDKPFKRRSLENIVNLYGYDLTLFQKVFSFCTDIYENVDAAIVRRRDCKWGIFHKEGVFFNNEIVIEPVVEKKDCEIVGFTYDSFAPFYTKEGNVAFVNRNCEIVSTLKINRKNREAALFDKKGIILGKWNFNEISIPEEFFFFGGNFSNLIKKNDFNVLYKKFMDKKYGNFLIHSEIHGPKINRKNKLIRNDMKGYKVYYGKILILSYVYYTKHQWSNYNFLIKYIWYLFKNEYDNFKKKIIRLAGTPSLSYGGCTIWKINNEFLVLDLFSDRGNGDFGYQIRMYICDEFLRHTEIAD